MIFEFGVYTDITEFVFENSPLYNANDYAHFFICEDVHDYWFTRVLKGYDKDYNRNDNKFIVERAKFAKDDRFDKLTINVLSDILDEDDGGNWDYVECNSIDEAIEIIDGGFGLN